MNMVQRILQAVAAKPAQGIQAGSVRNSYGFGYEAIDFGRKRPQAAWGRAQVADEEYHLNKYDRATMVLTCQDIYRNNVIAHGLVNRIADYVVHTGIKPQAQTSSKAWNDEAEAWFKEWGKIADYRRRPGTDFFRLQWMKVLDRYIHGESGDIITTSGQLQPIEMDRVQTPAALEKETTIRSGVKFDATGRLEGYYVCDQRPDGSVDPEKYTLVPSTDFIHVVWPWRVNQARGVPELAACIGKLWDLNEADESTLLKAKNDSKLFLKRIQDGGVGPLGAVGPRGTSVTTDSVGKTVLEHHDWGEIWNGKKGEDIASFRSEVPNSTYIPYMEFQCKLIGSCLGIPWEFILMVFTDGSFSAQRSGLMHMLHKIMGMHADLSRSYCQRVWNWRIARAMKYGDIAKAPVDKRGVSEWYKVQWSLPNMGWVDPEAAIQGDKTAWQMGVRSMKSIIGGYGEDRDDTFADKAADIESAGDVAAALNAKYPDREPITWRDIIDAGQITGQPLAAKPAQPDTSAQTEAPPPAKQTKGTAE